MRIERRLPFGFRGDWGMLFKRYTVDGSIDMDTEYQRKLGGIEISVDNKIVRFEKNYYVDIGQDVQFKKTSETTLATEQPISALVQSAEYTVVETTDAYFDDNRREYMCIVSVGDIVKAFGRFWTCTGIRTVSRFTPAEHKFFYLDLKSTL